MPDIFESNETVFANIIVDIVESNPFVRTMEIIPMTAEYWVDQEIDPVKFIDRLLTQNLIQCIEYVDRNNMPERIRKRLYPSSYTINRLRGTNNG